MEGVVIMKLPFPEQLASTPCKITIEQSGLDEDGNIIDDVIWTGKVVFTDKVKRRLNPDNSVIIIYGQILLKGDIAADKEVSSGTVVFFPDTDRAFQRKMFSCSKNHNPDGSIHSTYLELML